MMVQAEKEEDFKRIRRAFADKMHANEADTLA